MVVKLFLLQLEFFVRHSALAEVKWADLKNRKQLQKNMDVYRAILIHERWKIET